MTEDSNTQAMLKKTCSAQEPPGKSLPCTTCWNYREILWPPPDSRTYYWNFVWGELSRASENGCPVCAGLLSIVSTVLTKPITNFTMMASESNGLYFTVPQNTLGDYFEIYCRETVPKVLPHICPAREIYSSGSSAGCLELAKSWLHNCVSTHTSCAPAYKSYLPTRVIDVGSSTAEPHLHIPGGRGKEGTYIALSHCWSMEKLPLRTTVGNLASMCHEIPFSDLPRNFQDAVKVARAFNVRYLWIDSLCILQDCKNDWYTESAYMSDVYADALFVLVAAEGDSSESGFLEGKRRPQVAPITIGQAATEVASPLSVRPLPQLVDPYGSHNRHSDQRSKLSTRGWAFQEQILARRVLAYSDEEMSWECLKEGICECQMTAKIPRSINARLFIENAAKVKPQDYYSIFHKMWTSCVQEYTLRDLSFPSDRLAAISGLATRVSSPTTGKYLAGVWEYYLLHGLAWLARGNSLLFEDGVGREFNSRRQKQNYAPSWSWASITGPVTFWSVTARIEPIWDILVRRVHFLDGVGQYLSPREASLELAGRLVKIKIGEPEFKDEKLHLFKIFIPVDLAGEERETPIFLATPDICDPDYYDFRSSYYLLSLFHYKDHDIQNNNGFSIGAAALALVVRKTHEGKEIYERAACVLLTKGEYDRLFSGLQETQFTFI